MRPKTRRLLTILMFTSLLGTTACDLASCIQCFTTFHPHACFACQYGGAEPDASSEGEGHCTAETLGAAVRSANPL